MNIIDAIINLITNLNTESSNSNISSNRVNNAANGLEEYVKDLFSSTFNHSSISKEKWNSFENSNDLLDLSHRIEALKYPISKLRILTTQYN